MPTKDKIDRELDKALKGWEREAYRPGAAIDGSGGVREPKAGNGNQGGKVRSIPKDA